jgi:oligopeptide/dipeptide ABC transporter ATP-binding protein
MGEKWKDKWYSVFIVRIPLVNGFRRYVEMAARNRSLLMLRKVGIPNPTKVIDQYPHELSGGMQQRVLIAMALGCGARLLIADEPTTALDVTTQATILQLMKDLKSELGSSLLFITHDLGVICSMCDRVAVMYAGVIQEIAHVQDIFKHSLHPYTRLLLESMPKIRESQEFLGTIPGTVPILINPPKGCRFHARCPEAKEICAKERPILSRIDNDHWVACFNKTD